MKRYLETVEHILPINDHSLVQGFVKHPFLQGNLLGFGAGKIIALPPSVPRIRVHSKGVGCGVGLHGVRISAFATVSSK